MADAKISELTALAETPATGDLAVIVDVSDTTDAASGTTKKITRENLVGGLAPLASPTFTGTVNVSGLTASEIVVTDASKNLASAAVATYPSLAELAHVKGVTSAIQTQLGTKAGTALDNLASVAINTTLASDTDNTDDLGTTLKKWANLFVTTIGATATRVTRGWFTDIESTNMPTVGGTAILTSLTAPQFTTIELGHATDTTLSRVAAGQIAVEGVNVVTTSSTDTLSNKTLTAPKFADAGFIADANGNEQIVFQTTASAVNELEVTNAATGNAPILAATGGDTNIDLQLTPKGTGIVKGELKRFMVRLLDSTTALTTGTSKGGDFRIANRAITVKAVGAYVDTAATGATLVTVDINEAGTTILSTKITLDASEKTSTTAATPAVISDSAIAADAIVTFDIDAVGNTTPGNGLTVWVDYVYA